MAAIATYNLRLADDLLQNGPEPAMQIFQALGQGQSRQLLRYQAAEMNRTYFEYWELTQIPLGLALLATLALTKSSRLQIVLTAVMLLTVVAARFLLTPEIIGLGRLFDFESARSAQLVWHKRFAAFHTMYAGGEIVKLAAGVTLAGALLYRRGGESRRRELREEVDPVHHADHRHVDRS